MRKKEIKHCGSEITLWLTSKPSPCRCLAVEGGKSCNTICGERHSQQGCAESIHTSQGHGGAKRCLLCVLSHFERFDAPKVCCLINKAFSFELSDMTFSREPALLTANRVFSCAGEPGASVLLSPSGGSKARGSCCLQNGSGESPWQVSDALPCHP